MSDDVKLEEGKPTPSTSGAKDNVKNTRRAKSRQPTTQSLQRVARMIAFWQTRALMFDRFAEQTSEFRETETRGPRWLLKQQGGGPYPAELADVLNIERELRGYASEARRQMATLLAAQVTVDQKILERPDLGPGGPFTPALEGEALVENLKRPASVPQTDAKNRGTK